MWPPLIFSLLHLVNMKFNMSIWAFGREELVRSLVEPVRFSISVCTISREFFSVP